MNKVLPLPLTMKAMFTFLVIFLVSPPLAISHSPQLEAKMFLSEN